MPLDFASQILEFVEKMYKIMLFSLKIEADFKGNSFILYKFHYKF